MGVSAQGKGRELFFRFLQVSRRGSGFPVVSDGLNKVNQDKGLKICFEPIQEEN